MPAFKPHTASNDSAFNPRKKLVMNKIDEGNVVPEEENENDAEEAPSEKPLDWA